MSGMQISESVFQTVFEQAAIGIALVRPDGRWLKVNTKLCDFLGYSEEELLSLSFQDVTHQDDLSIDLSNVELMLTGSKEMYCLDKRYIRKDGSLVWGRLTVALVRGMSGQPEYFISCVEDVTARKNAEQVVQVGEEFFSYIFNAITFGIAVIDSTTGCFLKINRTYCDLLGYSQKEILDLSFQEITHPDDLAEDLQNMELLKTGRIRDFTMEKRYITQKRGTIWVKLTVFPMWSKGGPVTNHIAIVEDITAQKEIDHERKKYQESLESEVYDRTERLQKMVNAMADREIRMSELKKENAALKEMVRLLRDQLG